MERSDGKVDEQKKNNHKNNSQNMKMLSLSSSAAYMHSASFVRIRRKLIVRKTNDTPCAVEQFAVNVVRCCNPTVHTAHIHIVCILPLSSISFSIRHYFIARRVHCSCLLTCRQEICANAKCGRPFGKAFESRACRQHTLKYSTVSIRSISERSKTVAVGNIWNFYAKKKRDRKQSQPESLYVYMFWYLNKSSWNLTDLQWRRIECWKRDI